MPKEAKTEGPLGVQIEEGFALYGVGTVVATFPNEVGKQALLMGMTTRAGVGVSHEFSSPFKEAMRRDRCRDLID